MVQKKGNFYGDFEEKSKALNDHPALEPIAIIGIGCRLPGGADDPDKFWKLLLDGVDAITEVPDSRYNIDNFYNPDSTKPLKTNTRYGGFINYRIDEFDAQFFGMSPREAACLDPLQRWLLEVSWEALEDGGQIPSNLAGTNVGVFIGAFTLDYHLMQFCDSNRHLIEAHTGTGGGFTILSARLSYMMDFRGPCMSVDTACSSSLVAVHLACQSIWNGESTLALAGGCNAMFMPEYTITNSKAGMLSPDGHCKSFDSQANGYVRGEGAAIVVLKPLSKAIADGDQIYATIRGTACNQDGHSEGITVPNGLAQEAVMMEACKRANISPGQIQYVEAHGTGTPVGDPIEVNALANVLSQGRTAGQKCIIGSVKTNIGHTEAVSGVAGLIKTALCLKHHHIPKNLHFKNPNPKIAFEKLCVEVAKELTPWPKTDNLALAGLNSFGFGGTNVHVILEEAPPVTDTYRNEITGNTTTQSIPFMLPLSAKTQEALQALAVKYKELISMNDIQQHVSLQDICYNASLRRTHFDHRLMLISRSWEECIDQLDSLIAGESRPGISTGSINRNINPKSNSPRVVFVFSGMGPQWWAMGRQLLKEEPLFRKTLEECDEYFKKLANWSVIEEMMKNESESRMGETEVAQPANFFLQVGIAQLYRSWGINPDCIVGHSAGEAAAAYIAGAMNLEEAIRIIFHRSRLQQKTTGQGLLVAVGLSFTEVSEVIKGHEERISFAAINSPNSVTLVGDPEALEQVLEPLRQKQIFCKYLNVKVPYHSHYINPYQNELLEVLEGLKLNDTTIPLYSTVSGELIEGMELDAQYWWKNIRQPVYFAKAMNAIIDEGYSTFLEIGPHPVLKGSILECLTQQNKEGLVLPTLLRYENEQYLLLNSLGALWTQGFKIKWDYFYPEKNRFVRLPSYPWQREVYWNESEQSKHYRLGKMIHPLLGWQQTSPNPSWELNVDLWNFPYLADHRIQGTIVFPGAGYVEMAFGAAREVYKGSNCSISIQFRKALFIHEGEVPKLQISINKDKATFDIYSKPDDFQKPWVLHATGKLRQQQRVNSEDKRVRLKEIKLRCAKEITAAECYKQFKKMGLEYGRNFQLIDRFWQGANEALAQIKIPERVEVEADNYKIHPVLLDVCFQVLAAALPFTEDEKVTVYMPTSVEQGNVYGRPRSKMWIHSRIVKKDKDFLYGDICLCDESGNIFVEIRNCKSTILGDQKQQGLRGRAQDFYEVKWIPKNQEQVNEQKYSGQPSKWFIFDNKATDGERIAELLRQSGEQCVMIYQGDQYQALGKNKYQINPSNPEDYEKIFQESFENNPACRGIIHLWSTEIPPLNDNGNSALEKAEISGPLSLLSILHAVVKLNLRSTPRLWILTRGAQYIEGDPVESIAVAQSPIWGLSRVMGHQEHQNLWGGIIDLDPAVPDSEAKMIFDVIWNSSDEDEFVFRGEQCFVARIVSCNNLTVPLPASFRADCSYLITGGLGSLGLEVARWMVKNGARHLILMGRSKLLDRKQWGSIKKGDHQEEVINAIRELESMGAHCHLASADVESKEQLAEFLQEYQRNAWPSVRGVIHSAGVSRPQLLMNMDATEFKSVLRPKMFGSWNLHKLFEKEPLDFFIMFSSVASLVTSPGQANYAAGNAFLDMLVQYRRAMGLPALSINWGPWGEIGMATKVEELKEYFDRRGMYPMTTERGIEALAYVIGQNLPQVLIGNFEWPIVKEKNYPMGISPTLITEVVTQANNGIEKTEEMQEKQTNFLDDIWLSADPTKRKMLLAIYFQDILAKVLRLTVDQQNKLSVDQPLNYFGLDSMMAIELKNLIDRNLGVSVAVVDLLNGSSAEQLADKVMPELLENHQLELKESS